jgi:tetratricopeptide (TPR) repeat protein
MNEDEAFYEQIENYLAGNISPQEKARFEEQIRLDAHLAQEVEALRTARFVLKTGALLDIKEQLRGYSKELEKGDKKKGKVVFPHPWVWAVAASVVLAVGLFLWIGKGNTNEQLFAEYYRPYPNFVAPVKMGEQDYSYSDTTKRKAFFAYDQGSYKDAIPLFKQCLVDQNDSVVTYYLGNAYLGANLPKEASETYLPLLQLEGKGFLFFIQTQWYLSLCYLKMNRLQEARQILETIRSSKNEYSERADQLLMKLD